MPQPKDHAQTAELPGKHDRGTCPRLPGAGVPPRKRRIAAELAGRPLQRSKRAIDELARQLADAAGQVDLLPQIDRLRVRLDRLLGRVRGAMQGYSGFFDLVRIDVPLLDRVYEHDAALNEQVDAFAKAAEELPGGQDSTTAVSDLLGQIDQIERHWDPEDMLKGV